MKKRLWMVIIVLCTSLCLMADIIPSSAAAALEGKNEAASIMSLKKNASTVKYRVKEGYAKDLGKKFQKMKKKYHWTLTNGIFSRMEWCNYETPKEDVTYTFQGSRYQGEGGDVIKIFMRRMGEDTS